MEERPRSASARACSKAQPIARARSSALLVTFLSSGEVTADPLQRGLLVEYLGLSLPVAEVVRDVVQFRELEACRGWRGTRVPDRKLSQCLPRCAGPV